MIPEMIPEARAAIRPSPEELAAMPTMSVTREAQLPDAWREELARHGYHYRRELKLMRLTASYCYNRQGIPPDAPLAKKLPFLVEGSAIIFPNPPLLPGQPPMLWYSPEDTPRLQRMDYFEHLQLELLMLRQHQDKEPGPQLARRIEEVRLEAVQVWNKIKEDAASFSPEWTPEQIAKFRAVVPDFLMPDAR